MLTETIAVDIALPLAPEIVNWMSVFQENQSPSTQIPNVNKMFSGR